jgi:hypothetical protein
MLTKLPSHLFGEFKMGGTLFEGDSKRELPLERDCRVVLRRRTPRNDVRAIPTLVVPERSEESWSLCRVLVARFFVALS